MGFSLMINNGNAQILKTTNLYFLWELKNININIHCMHQLIYLNFLVCVCISFFSAENNEEQGICNHPGRKLIVLNNRCNSPSSSLKQ